MGEQLGAPRTTIVVVPRESYSVTPLMLENLIARTPEPRRVVLAIGGSPRKMRRRLERLASEHDITFIHREAVITPNEARNLAMPHVATPLVCFLDNDTLVDDRWLERLEQCADETGASLVSCPVLWGHDDAWEIHYAGGMCRVVDDDGARRLEEDNRLMHHPVAALDELVRAPTEYVEPHCFLVRVDVLDQLGPFDEELLFTRDHSRLSLQVTAAGGEIWLEPSTVVMYPFPKRNTLGDYRLYLPHWGDEWSERSFRRFNAIMDLNDDTGDDLYRGGHRGRLLGEPPPRGRRPRAVWRRVRYRVRSVITISAAALMVRVVERERSRRGPAHVVHRASWDQEAQRASSRSPGQ
jgi:hypothetical protein